MRRTRMIVTLALAGAAAVYGAARGQQAQQQPPQGQGPRLVVYKSPT